jgi:hypothetical protein
MFRSRAMRCAVSGCVENIRIMARPENGLAIINELTGPDNSQRALSGRRLGFVSRDAELFLLAETIQVQPRAGRASTGPGRPLDRSRVLGFGCDGLGQIRDPVSAKPAKNDALARQGFSPIKDGRRICIPP